MQGPQGVELSLISYPAYDNPVNCRVPHPLYPDKPVDSGRLTILDFGSTKADGNKNNIMMLTRENKFSYGHVPGRLTPTGMVKGSAAKLIKSLYEIFN